MPCLSAENTIRATAQQLIDNTDFFNDKRVIIQGEAIGDIMKRKGFSWVNIQDETNVIGVTVSDGLAGLIEETGDYEHRGDIIEAEGIFLASDPSLGGEMCLRAERIGIIKNGYRTFHVLEPFKERMALILPLAAFVLAALSVNYIKHLKSKAGQDHVGL